MFLLTGSSKDLPEAIFCICAHLQISFFFPNHFLFQSRAGCSLSLVGIEQVCIGIVVTGFLSQRRGILHAGPSAPQAVGYICSLCCNYSQYGPNSCPLEDNNQFSWYSGSSSMQTCVDVQYFKRFLQLL